MVIFYYGCHSLVSYHVILCALSEDSEPFSDVQSSVSPLNDDFESLMGTLGLSERKPVPDPVFFEESDPLGTSLMTSPDSGGALMGKNADFFSDFVQCYLVIEFVIGTVL